MKNFDRYLDAVMHNVFASPEDRGRLEADLRAHFAQAESQAESADEIIAGLGTPEEVAAAFNTERGIRYAGFWQRFIAFVGDCGLLVALAGAGPRRSSLAEPASRPAVARLDALSCGVGPGGSRPVCLLLPAA